MSRDTFRSDGNAVDVVLAYDVEKGDVVVAQGWFGIAMKDGAAGDTIAIEVGREHALPVGAATAAKGDVLYVAQADGTITNTNTDVPFGKVTRAKDANNVAWVKLLPQTA